MSETFKQTYPDTDCTELFRQRHSLLSIQSSVYSSSKYRVTYKGLIGIAPSGAVTFTSNLYPGSISDKLFAVVVCFGLAWAKNDSIMADRGSLISDDLESIGVSLNIPAFLKVRGQLTKAEAKTMSETQKKFQNI